MEIYGQENWGVEGYYFDFSDDFIGVYIYKNLSCICYIGIVCCMYVSFVLIKQFKRKNVKYIF